MSTFSILHVFGIRGYRLVGVQRQEGSTTLFVEPCRAILRCSACNSGRVSTAGWIHRRLRSVPCGIHRIWIAVAVPRLFCGKCHRTRQLRLTFADPRQGYTQAFATFVVRLAQQMSLRAVAKLLHVGWDLVKSIVKRYLKQRFCRPPLAHVKRIAIDEIHLGKKIGFFTIVLDLDTSAVLFVGRGRSAATLDPFWEYLRASGAQIQAVATDLAQVLRAVVKTHLPNALHVIDRFHMVKLYNEMLDHLRRIEFRRAHAEARIALTGTKWLLLKRSDNLVAGRNEPQRLEAALQANRPLMIAYYLGEDLRNFWQQDSRAAAAAFLESWIKSARTSGVGLLTHFGRKLVRHTTTLLNWYDHPISTGPLEGANGRIRLMQRRSYGFRDLEFLELSIMAMHQATYA